MLRLLILSDDPGRWRAVEDRLAGVSIEARTAPANNWDSFDAVVITAPIEANRIEEPLRAGKPVLSTMDADHDSNVIANLQSIASEFKAQFAAVNCDRFLPSRQLMRQQIPDKIGMPGMIRVQHWDPGEMRQVSLRCHIDTVIWLAGALPDRIFALSNGVPGKSMTQIHLGFPGGGMAIIDEVGGLPGGADYRSLSVIGSTGAAYADDHNNMQLLYRGDKPAALRAEEGIRQSVEMIRWFAESVRAGLDLSDTVREQQRIFVIVDAVKESLARQQSIALTWPVR